MRFELKRRTTVAHERLDAAVSRLSLADRGAYTVFLQTHQAAYQSLLTVISGRHWMTQILQQGRAELVRDLDVLGASEPDHRVVTIPSLHPLAVAYVVTGSHFGKKILSRRWAETTDPKVAAAGTFLTSSRLAAGWKELMAELDDVPRTNAMIQTLATDADRVFTLFYDCFCAVSHLEKLDA